MQKYFNNVQTTSGIAVNNASITVYTQGGAVATIYSDNGITTQSNPTFTNEAGMFSFYAADGRYDLTVVANGQTTTITDVLFEDLMDGSDAVFTDVQVDTITIQGTDLSIPINSSLVNFLQAGTGAVARTGQSKLRENVSVKDFGAVGDGVTDDTAAIQAAITYANSVSGLGVYFPEGIYMLSTSLILKDNISFIGVYNLTELKLFASTDAQIVAQDGSQTSGVPLTNFTFENIIFNSNALGTEMFAKSAVAISGVMNIKFIGCTFKNATGYGLGLQAYEGSMTLNGPQEDILIQDCVFANNGHTGLPSLAYDGMDIKASKRCHIRNIVAYGNGEKGWNVRGSDISVNGAVSYDNGASGFDVVSYRTQDGSSALSNIFSHDNTGDGGNISLTEKDGYSTTVVQFTMSNIICKNNTGNGLTLGTSAGQVGGYVTVSGSNVILSSNGGAGLASSIDNSLDVYFTGLVCNNNTLSGISQTGDSLRIVNGSARNNGAYGYTEATASVGNVLINVDLQNNTTAAANLAATSATVLVNCAGSNASFNFSSTANARHSFTSVATAGTDPIFKVTGLDANRGAIFQSKGSGTLKFATVSDTNTQFAVGHGGSAVTAYIEARGSTTSPALFSQGSAANIDMTFVPKGTGFVSYGTFTASADAPVVGYITIKDIGGTVRKLAVIA